MGHLMYRSFGKYNEVVGTKNVPTILSNEILRFGPMDVSVLAQDDAPASTLNFKP